ncbi:hypothetical protein DPMN_142196 [Dreissena polymorpha]|uniref:Uncharacterized protein n=1 Tax=Dreissena polymorpha TaxID=45954 RepID=A0A9D4GAU2_DREPO|nr:hypothetical protein DPMN_142196 [Dreissena polymorpha]
MHTLPLAANNFMEKKNPIKLKEGPLNKKVCTCKKPRRPILGRKEIAVTSDSHGRRHILGQNEVVFFCIIVVHKTLF